MLNRTAEQGPYALRVQLKHWTEAQGVTEVYDSGTRHHVPAASDKLSAVWASGYRLLAEDVLGKVLLVQSLCGIFRFSNEIWTERG